MARLSASALLRRVDALTRLANGQTQREVATQLGINERTVRKWAELNRLGIAIPPGQLADVLKRVYDQERFATARARILGDMTKLVLAEARVNREEVRRSGPFEWPTAPPPVPEPDIGFRRRFGIHADPEALRRAAASALEHLREHLASAPTPVRRADGRIMNQTTNVTDPGPTVPPASNVEGDMRGSVGAHPFDRAGSASTDRAPMSTLESNDHDGPGGGRDARRAVGGGAQAPARLDALDTFFDDD